MGYTAAEGGAKYKCKLVVTGDGACGKTCLLIRITTNTFIDDMYVPTVFDMYADSVAYKDSHVEVSLWDTAGQEDFEQLRMLSYNEADVVMICYCVDNIDSIVNVAEKWGPEAASKAPRASIILCGCKTDQRTNDNQPGHVPREMANMYAQKLHADAVLETSALTGEGTKNVLETVVDVWSKQKTNGKGAAQGCCSIL